MGNREGECRASLLLFYMSYVTKVGGINGSNYKL